jgi:predicted ATPase
MGKKRKTAGSTTRSKATKPRTAIVDSVALRRDSVPSFDEYPFNIPALREMRELKLHPKVTFFVGENGSGKSTLLEAIATQAGLNPEGGSKNFHFSNRESHSTLWKYIELGQNSHRLNDAFFLRAESLFNVATEIERLDDEPGEERRIIDAYGGKSLHEQSHGESFFALMINRLRPGGFYLLDEPEAALSPQRQLSFLTLVHQLVEQRAQFVIATHSPIILGYPHAAIHHFSEAGIQAVEYEDTEQFQVTNMFLKHRRSMLAELLAGPQDS